MIWDSIPLMTVLDLTFAVLATVAWVFLRRLRDREWFAAGGRGLTLVTAALGLLGAFYVTDLLIMLVLPHLIGPQRAMTTMEGLHLNYGWIVSLSAACLALGGIVSMTRSIEAFSKARLASRERTELVLRSSIDGIFAFGKDLRLFVWNPAMEFITGMPADQALGREVEDALVSLLPRGEFGPMMGTLAGQSAVVAQQAYSISETGRDGYFEARYSPIGDQDRGIVGGLGIIRDTTEMRRSEVRMRESELRFRALTEAAFEGIGFTIEGVIIDVNERVADMLGYTREELLGMSTRELVIPEHWSTVQEKVASPTDEPYEITMLRKDGTTFPAEIHGRDIDDDGRVVRVTGVRDVSHLRLAEAEIRDNNARLRALAARLQSVREEERKGIARELHDQLGQAMTALSMSLATLGEALPDDRPDLKRDTDEMLRRIDTNVALIQDLTTRLRPPMLDALGLPDAVQWLSEDVGNRSGLQMDLQLIRAEDLELDTDISVGVFRVIQESLTNVVRHAHADSVAIRIDASASKLSVSVTDDGVGIPECALDDIRSIGLAGMFERAEAFGGTLRIGRAQGQGTRVELSVPLLPTSGSVAFS